VEKSKTGRLTNSLADAADQIGCGYSILWRLWKSGGVQTRNVNGVARVLPGEIERLRPLIGRQSRPETQASTSLEATE
jgi:hypothetical protein